MKYIVLFSLLLTACSSPLKRTCDKIGGIYKETDDAEGCVRLKRADFNIPGDRK